VPVIAAFSTDLVYKKLMPIDGFGAHLDPKVALVRALLEIVTTRGLFIQKYGLAEWKPSYQDGDVLNVHADDFRFYAFESKNINDLEKAYSSDILQDIRTMTTKLVDRGFGKIIAVDLTQPETGIPTVRVIVPGMEAYCFDRSRIGKRLFDALGHR
jgi:YcaO-like protein with predicted kinase domain